MNSIAISSGKGGTGKTTLAANLSVTLAKSGRNVVVFDGDLALANLDILMGVRAQYNLADVLGGRKTLQEVIVRGPVGVGIVAGGSALGNLMRAGPKRLGAFLTQLAELESWVDDLIIDTSAGIDVRVKTFLRAANLPLLVTTPDPASITDAYAVAKTLWRVEPESTIAVAVNMAPRPKVGEAVFNALNDVAMGYLKKQFQYVGSISEDQAIRDCVRQRVPFAESRPQIAAAKDLSHMARAILALCEKLPRAGFAERLLGSVTEAQAA
jgi:flagellar biosynthesis protein FlhG